MKTQVLLVPYHYHSEHDIQILSMQRMREGSTSTLCCDHGGPISQCRLIRCTGTIWSRFPTSCPSTILSRAPRRRPRSLRPGCNAQNAQVNPECTWLKLKMRAGLFFCPVVNALEPKRLLPLTEKTESEAVVLVVAKTVGTRPPCPCLQRNSHMYFL